MEEDSAPDGGCANPSAPKKARKAHVTFLDNLKTLLGKTIHDSHSKYFPVLVKGNHNKSQHLLALVHLINQHLESEFPGKELRVDSKIVGGWVLRCVEAVQTWR